LLVEELKSLPNTLNILVLLSLGSAVLCYKGKKRIGRIGLSLAFFFFLVASTSFFPQFAIEQLEEPHQPLDVKALSKSDGRFLIHVLGGGYSLDPVLPANSQLELITLGRLAEGLRICHQLPGSTLVCSGYSSLGRESQASVVRRAAISLGLDSTRIVRLNTPSTTEEEAKALLAKFGSDSPVIVVTDAVHMSRAIRLFEEQGLNPIAAPTNFLVKSGPKERYLGWLPSINNISLTDRVLHEYLGNIKAAIF
jgi:uncharacterized SAM-binding protein YcdF (DUF218 family)